MSCLRFTCLLVVLATFVSISTSFMVRTSVLPSRTRRLSSSEGDDGEAPPSPQTSLPKRPAQSSEEKLDPLIASLTRNDQMEGTAKSVKAPLLGEIPVDGSLIVLVPALVLGVVGFVMSINIAINSQDAIVDSLNQLSEDVTAAAVAKTNSAAPLDGSCRGICTNPEDLDGLKTFMESLKK